MFVVKITQQIRKKQKPSLKKSLSSIVNPEEFSAFHPNVINKAGKYSPKTSIQNFTGNQIITINGKKNKF